MTTVTAILKRELIAVLRTRKAFWLLLAAVVASMLIPLVEWPSGSSVNEYRIRNLFGAFALTQLIASLLAVTIVASSAYSLERERDSWDILRSTLISPLAILLAKFVASTGYVYLVLVAVAPCLSVLFLLGGIGWDRVIQAYAINLVAVAVTALVCLTVSYRSRRTVHSAVRSILWSVFWNFGLFLIMLLLVALGGGFNPVEIFWLSSTFTCAYTVWESSAGVSVGYFVFSGLVAGGHLLFLATRETSVSYPVSLVETSGSLPAQRSMSQVSFEGPARPKAVASAAGSEPRRTWVTKLLLAIPEISPVFAREMRSEFFGRLWFRRTAFWTSGGFFALVAIASSESLLYSIMAVAFLALVLVSLVLPGVAATAVPREEDGGTLDLLRGTRLTAASIVNGKLLANLYAVLGILGAALVVMFFVFALTPQGYPTIHQVGDFAARSLLGSFVIFAGTTGLSGSFSLWLGVLLRRSVAALTLAYILLAALFILVPVCIFGFWNASEEDFAWTSPWMTLGFCIHGSNLSDHPWRESLVGFALTYGGLAVAFRFLAIRRLAKTLMPDR